MKERPQPKTINVKVPLVRFEWKKGVPVFEVSVSFKKPALQREVR